MFPKTFIKATLQNKEKSTKMTDKVLDSMNALEKAMPKLRAAMEALDSLKEDATAYRMNASAAMFAANSINIHVNNLQMYLYEHVKATTSRREDPQFEFNFQ